MQNNLQQAHMVCIEQGPMVRLPTPFGEFQLYAFTEKKTGECHLALVYGSVMGKRNVLVRLHSECLTGDALFSLRCDCREQLQHALERIAKEGSGVLLYMRQEGRGIGLSNKLKAYALQDEGYDTVEANEKLGFAKDGRSYSIPIAMLQALGVTSIRLMTNNPEKITALQEGGIVVRREPMPIKGSSYNKKYLETKKAKMGHLLE